jgi:hypothetical protein
MKSKPAPADRIIDATALLVLLGGIGLFAFARSALTGIAEGTHAIPQGISAVAVTDFHVAQTKIGMFLIGAGVAVGIVAAVRHRVRQARMQHAARPAL